MHEMGFVHEIISPKSSRIAQLEATKPAPQVGQQTLNRARPNKTAAFRNQPLCVVKRAGIVDGVPPSRAHPPIKNDSGAVLGAPRGRNKGNIKAMDV